MWLVLGVIAEGCCDALRQGLAEILPRLLASIQDPEYYVRECACFALGEQSYMRPSKLIQFYVRTLTFLPHVFQHIYFSYFCFLFALGQLSEYCQPEILHYHQSVLPIVFQALEVRPDRIIMKCYVLLYIVCLHVFSFICVPSTPLKNPLRTDLFFRIIVLLLQSFLIDI